MFLKIVAQFKYSYRLTDAITYFDEPEEKTRFNCIHLSLDHFATAHCNYSNRTRVHFKEKQQLQIIYISHEHPGCGSCMCISPAAIYFRQLRKSWTWNWTLDAGASTELGQLARRPNYPNAIKVIKAIIRRVKRLSENTSSGWAWRTEDVFALW